MPTMTTQPFPDEDELSGDDSTMDLVTEAIESVKHERATRQNFSFDIDTIVPANEGQDHLTTIITTTTPEVKLEKFDYDATAVDMMKFQVEHHFSDENLAMDNRMLTRLHQDPEYWVSIKAILAINQIAEITDDPNIVKKAVRQSKVLMLNKEETKVKRENFVPPKPRHHKNMRRTIFIYGLSDEDNVNTVSTLCQVVGNVNAIVFDDGKKYIFNTEAIKAMDLDMIDREVAVGIMTKKFGPQAVRSNSAHFGDALSPTQTSAWLQMEQKRVSSDLSQEDTMTRSLELQIPDSSQAPNRPVFVHPIPNSNGDPLDFSHLKSCFVVFQSQSIAQKFVKSRARAADGIRALQQYEYIKYQKKLCMNKARGISALMSPNSIKLALNSPSYAILGAMHRPSRSSGSPSSTTVSPQPASPRSTSEFGIHERYEASYNLEPIEHGPSPKGAQAMQYFLGNYKEGAPMVVPEAVADALAHEFQEKLSLVPPSKPFRRHTHGPPSTTKGGKYQAPRRSAGFAPHNNHHQQIRHTWHNHAPPSYRGDRMVGRSWDHRHSYRHSNMSGAGRPSGPSPRSWDHHHDHHQGGHLQAPMSSSQRSTMNNGDWRKSQRQSGKSQSRGTWRKSEGGRGGKGQKLNRSGSYNVTSNAPHYPMDDQQYDQ